MPIFEIEIPVFVTRTPNKCVFGEGMGGGAMGGLGSQNDGLHGG